MELRDYLRILRAHWIGIVALTALGGLVAFGWSMLQPRVYTAESSGYVRALDAGGSDDTSSALIGNQLAQSKIASFVDIGTWRSVAEHAIDDLGLDTTPEALVTRVHVDNPLDTTVIHVSAQAGSPEEARDLAEAWVRGMSAEVDKQEGDGTAGSAAVGIANGESARLPTSPSSPNTRLNVALGLLIGLALGIAYAVIRRILDRRVRNARDIERETGSAVIGTIPLEKDLDDTRKLFAFDGHTQAETSVAVAESLRELRTNLQFIDVDNPPRVIIVTSPLPGDGKSTTAANLALSLAAAGQPTVLIDADLRRPVVGSIFDLPEGAGLSAVLAGSALLDDVLHNPADNLMVLTAGKIPATPSELLGSKRMRDLLAGLAREAIVIVDSPPTVPVTDAAILTASADGAVLVVSAGRTTYEVMQKAMDNIARANGRLLGVVLNKVPRRGADSGYYGYGYKGYYTATDTTDTAATKAPDRRTRRAQKAAR